MQPSTHDLRHSLEKPASEHNFRQRRISPHNAMNAIERGEQLPTAAELLYALERSLHAVERGAVLRHLLRVLATVCSHLVLEGDDE